MHAELAGAKIPRRAECSRVSRHGKKTCRPDSTFLVTTEGVVHVVDDDGLMRSSLKRLLLSGNLDPRLYACAADILALPRLDYPGCILMDLRMPGMSGLQAQDELIERGNNLPIIFLTGSADVPVAVEAMRKGAVDFIEKPFENIYLLKRVKQAIQHNRSHQVQTEERAFVRRCMDQLTRREHDVLELVVNGLTSKEIARELGISHRTIEIHRNHLMEKMQAGTLADLIRMRLLIA